MTVIEMKNKIDEAIKAYSEGNEIMSDEEYDNLLEEYLNKTSEDNRPFLRQQQSTSINDVVGTLSKVYGLSTPMREGQKVYNDWISRIKPDQMHTICVQPKFDGCSVAYDCKTKRFFTRGKYDDGISIDVSELFEHHIIMVDNYEQYDSIKFEAIMANEVFENSGIREKYDYKRPRDAVSATITSRRIEMAKYITLIPLRVNKNGVQSIPKFLMKLCTLCTVSETELIQLFIDKLLNNQANVTINMYDIKDLSYACDGVVVSLTDNVDMNKVDGEEVAIKILNNTQTTKLIKVDYQFGKTGRITPVAIVQPVKFGNVTVSNITLSTLDRVDKMHLKHNDTVRIIYNIVPYLLTSEHDGDIPIQLPQVCPVCGSKLDLSSLSLIRCTNPNCNGLKVGAIIRYCQKMMMYGVSEGIITKLFDLGIVTSISDLYTLKESNISTINGFGPTSAHNIVKSIKDASTNVEPARWLGAFPFVDIGVTIWRTIINGIKNRITETEFISMFDKAYPIEMINSLKQLQFGNIRGIGDVTSARIVQGLTDNWLDISFVSHYVKFKLDDNTTKKGVVTLTGTRDKDVSSYLESKGYEVNTSFTQKTTILVIPNESFTSSKVAKAKQNNIPIYTINDIKNVIQ